MDDERNRNNPNWCCNKVEELIEEYKNRLSQSQKETQGFTEYEATYTAAKEAMLEDVIERLEAILYA